MVFHLQLFPKPCDTAAASAASFPRMEAEGGFVAAEMVTAADETRPAGCWGGLWQTLSALVGFLGCPAPG